MQNTTPKKQLEAIQR